MNILLLNWRDVSHPKSGGAELVTMEHAKGWVKKGHSVTWVTAGYNNAKKNETVDGIRFVRRMGSFSIYLYVPFYVLWNSFQFDVIVDEVHGFPFFTPLVTRKPIVVFIHEIAGEIWDFMFPFPKNKIGKLLEYAYFHLYTSCIFWTDAPSTVNELISRGIPKNRCVAIPCPIPRMNASILGLFKKKPVKETNPTYLFVSRVVRMKGVEEVIKAFAFIYLTDPTSVLWIIGSGEATYITELKQMISEYGLTNNVVFWGSISDTDKYSLMSKSHILLHASVKEGWGLVVLEAAYAGTPSVVYNVGGLRDVVKHGETGIVVDSNSPKEMAEKAIQLYKNKKLYAKMQISGKKWVQSITWTNVIQRSLNILRNSIQFR